MKLKNKIIYLIISLLLLSSVSYHIKVSAVNEEQLSDTKENESTEKLSEESTEEDSDLQSSEADDDGIDELTEDFMTVYDLDTSSIYAYEAEGQTIQNTLTGASSAYWNASNSFLMAKDAYGKTVPAYCMQPKKASPNINVKLTEGNSVLSSNGLQAAACAIATFGYGGEGADPNSSLYGISYNKDAGGSYASYVINGRLVRGLMINGKIYEMTPREAQAVTGAAIHYFSALAGQGDSVSVPTQSRINSSHNSNVSNAFNDLVFLGSHFMNQYGSLENVALAVSSGTNWVSVLDDYNAVFNWQIKKSDGSYVDYNQDTDNYITNEDYLIDDGEGESIVLKLKLNASKCSIRLLDNNFVTSKANKGTVLANNNTVQLPDGSKKSMNYFYVASNKECTIDYGPIYNESFSQMGPTSILSLPNFIQEVIITIPVESAKSGIVVEAHTLECFSATPIYGDGDKDGVSNYSCRLFSDVNSNRDYQDVLFFSPGNTFDVNTASSIRASFNYYGNLELYKSSGNSSVSDNNSNYSLKDAEYRIYSNNEDAKNNQNSIGSLITDSNGYAIYNNLEAGTYYVKEYKAPKGFLTDDNIYTAVIENGQTVSETITTSLYLSDNTSTTPVDIALYKTDEEGVPLGNAEFTIKYYDIISDTDPAALGIKPVKEWTFRTNPDTGIAHFNSEDKISGDDFYYDKGNVVLPLGTITIEETKAPLGYERNNYTDIQIISTDSSTNKIIKYNPPEITNKKIRQSVEFVKLGEADKESYIPLEKAGFMACPISELKTDENGNYIWDEEKAVILTDSGEKEIFTDVTGYAKTIPLDYGSYLFKETTIPVNFLPIDDFTVDINSSVPETKQLGTLYDRGFNIYLKINKICEKSKKNIINNPAVFSIWSYGKNEYISFDGVTELYTDENGELITPSPLYAGKYRIDEISCPTGYSIIDENGIDFEITDNNIYEIIPDNTSSGVLTVDVENRPVNCSLTIEKSGEVLIKSFDGESFSKSSIPLSDVTFGIYAYEDIYTIDGHKDIIFTKNALVKNITTDSYGTACITDLPYGKYIIRELVTPKSYIPSDDIIITVNKEQQTEKINNSLLKSKISINKKSEDGLYPVEGAYYAIYEYDDTLKSADEYRKKDFIEEKSTDKDGNISFDTALPPGIYAVIETKAPSGFYISDKIEVIDTKESKQGEANLSGSINNIGIVSSAYSDSEGSHFDEYNYYNLSVFDKKIPDTQKSPKTGDSIMRIIILLLCSGIIIAYNIIKKHKDLKNKAK